MPSHTFIYKKLWQSGTLASIYSHPRKFWQICVQMPHLDPNAFHICLKTYPHHSNITSWFYPRYQTSTKHTGSRETDGKTTNLPSLSYTFSFQAYTIWYYQDIPYCIQGVYFYLYHLNYVVSLPPISHFPTQIEKYQAFFAPSLCEFRPYGLEHIGIHYYM